MRNTAILGVSRVALLVACCALAPIAQARAGGPAAPVDVEGAKALAKQSNCFKCHSVDKQKDGPTWRSVAEKYRAKPDAERMERLTTHITSGEMVKFEDGHKEHHAIVKTKDAAKIGNLVRYILSL